MEETEETEIVWLEPVRKCEVRNTANAGAPRRDSLVGVFLHGEVDERQKRDV